MEEVKLGVNIDHIATLRNARGVAYPDPVYAAAIAEQNGADGITIHLREDRRHIKDRDVVLLAETIQTRMNLEMAMTDEMVDIACKTKPAFVCLVPEKREELTTEGGLDVYGQLERTRDVVARLSEAGILVSLFIDADKRQIEAAKEVNAPYIELHTGHYAETSGEEQQKELRRIQTGARDAHQLGLVVNAGHGLHYHNTRAIAQIPELYELNIGHAIIAKSVFSGLAGAVREMKDLLIEARKV
ncbi:MULTISPECIES: pyridoxine 5'-phosphate synthase [Gammaproteobacteria]|uniref:pyridoxine 5'-phosphate synthase n=1 Tax=Gammaproteobacteria TaxID=1236 RepID=UPI000DD00BA0|nr:MULTISPECIES: pyridoxine 5'-phosphate synthase [Gammaproteobacteria]RTE87111.1 pyridoxine 5'-phosphate synthase [Aliidiomarina sp. B3213]TCZ93101.1 pyridoxine 5'-phosphate synthase [Lysobacter sp. N42]